MKRFVTPVGLLAVVTLLGTLGFRFVVGRPWLESLYLAVITLSTVGSRDPATDATSTLFVIAYLITGLGIFTFSAFQFGSWIVSADYRSLLERRKMLKQISQLQNHSLVCGYGRMGRTICEYLAQRNRPFVVIDLNEERLSSECRERGWLYVAGDATNDDTLKQAGIERASALTSVLATDADNLYVVLSARMLNSRVKIIARASDEKAIEKMERAGATRVVSPFSSGAVKMARFMLNPGIEDFIEIAHSHGAGLELADILIGAENPYVGKRLMDTDLRARGVMVLGIRPQTGPPVLPPPGSAVINAGDCLFVFGPSDAVNTIAATPSSRAAAQKN